MSRGFCFFGFGESVSRCGNHRVPGLAQVDRSFGFALPKLVWTCNRAKNKLRCLLKLGVHRVACLFVGGTPELDSLVGPRHSCFFPRACVFFVGCRISLWVSRFPSGIPSPEPPALKTKSLKPPFETQDEPLDF